MRPVVVACALVPSLLAWGPAALADDDTSDLQSVLSSPVVSTASKTPEMDTVSPGTTTVVTGEDMMRYGMRTVGEAVNFLAMGVVGDSPQGLDADDFGARGVLVTGDLGAHFLVMIDGHTVNQPLGGTGEFYSSHAIGASFGPALGVPLELVDHIEVTLGPGSVLYGSNAMLGIVNVVTKRAAAFEGVHVAADSQLLTTGRVFAGGGHAFTLFGKPAEATAGFEYFTRKGPGIDIPVQVSGGGPYGGTAHDNSMQVPSGIARLRVGSLELSARATLKDASLPLPTGVFDDPKAHDLERRLSFEVSHRASISELLVVTSRAYFDTYDLRGTYEIFSNVSLPLTAAAYWGGAEVRGSFDWFGNGRFVTLVGAEGTYRQVGQLGLVELSGNPSQVTGHLDRHDVILAAYGEQTWRPRRWLALNAGLRLDYDERFPAVASPRVAASVKPWEGGTIKLMYSEAFRAPTLAESYGSLGLLITPQQLDPETVRSVEASIAHDFGTQRLLFGAYYSVWNDLIYLHQFTPAEVAAGLGGAGQAQEQNSTSLTNPGLNASFQGQLAEGRLQYGITWTEAVAHPSGGGILPASPTTFGNAHVSYDLQNGWPVLAVAASYVGERRAPVPLASFLDNNLMPTAPPQLALRPTATGPVPGVDGLSYRVSVNYVFGTKDPYLIGPAASLSPNASQLVPIEKFRALVGLAYQFQ
ncbi:MAG TPA: TonB-dependent receptor [Polyangiaceae bacterium]|nr:TonB-dependent receptor [Polyangiaceae bacterium]